MKTYLKFNCIYCGQHLECEPHLSGRQVLCPSCLHRIAIPAPRASNPAPRALAVPNTWDTHVPFPRLEIPTRHRNPVLAQAA